MSTLSVLMANYNHAHFVGGALQAILSQSYQPKEIVVIDDGSTDNSIQVLSEFEKKHPTIRLYKNERNLGVVVTANRALALAQGDYVYCAAADDRVLPGFFEKTMKLLWDHPYAGLCCSDPATFDHTGILCENPARWNHSGCYLSPDSFADVLKGGFIAGHTTIARRSCMLEFDGFQPDLKWACDWFLYLAIAFKYGICYIPEALAAFRRNPVSFSAVGERNEEQQAEVLNRLLTIVSSQEYGRLLPYFARSGAFHHFGMQLPKLVLGKPELWRTEIIMLLLFPFYEWSCKMAADRDRLQANVRSNLKKLVPAIVERCRKDKIERVILYGFGSHTAMLLPLWKEAMGPPVERIIATEPGGTCEFMGLPVVSIKDYHPLAADGIVLSSYTYEMQMKETCRNMWPNIHHYFFYTPLPGEKLVLEPHANPSITSDISIHSKAFRTKG